MYKVAKFHKPYASRVVLDIQLTPSSRVSISDTTRSLEARIISVQLFIFGMPFCNHSSRFKFFILYCSLSTYLRGGRGGVLNLPNFCFDSAQFLFFRCRKLVQR